jgi:phosphonate transport system permease protein
MTVFIGQHAAPARARGLFALAVLVALTVLAWAVGGYDLSALSTAQERAKAVARVGGFLRSFGAPNLSAEFVAYVVPLALTSLAMAMLGTALAVAFAFVLSLVASRAVFVGDARGWARRIRVVCSEGARLVQDVLRGVPDFLWAVFLIPLLGFGAQTGVCALALNVAGILARVYSESYDAVSPRQLAAIRSVGAGRLQTLFYGVLPRVRTPLLSFTLLRWECSVRNAAVIGAVGAGGLGDEIRVRTDYGEYDKVLTCMVLMLLLTIGSDLLSQFVRGRLERDGESAGVGSLATARRRLLGTAAVTGIALVLSTLWLWRDLAQLGGTGGQTWGEKFAFVGEFFGPFLTPDLTWLGHALAACVLPLSMAFLATLAAVLVSALLSYWGSLRMVHVAARRANRRGGASARLLLGVRAWTARAVAVVLRGVPEVFWAYLLVSFFLPGPIAGVVALTFHTIGILVRLFIENVDGVPEPALARVQATVGSPAKTFVYGAVPAVAPHWLANAFFQLESNVRTAIVLGAVGVGGLGHFFQLNFAFFKYREASTYLIVIVVLSLVLDRLSRVLGWARAWLSG